MQYPSPPSPRVILSPRLKSFMSVNHLRHINFPEIPRKWKSDAKRTRDEGQQNGDPIQNLTLFDRPTSLSASQNRTISKRRDGEENPARYSSSFLLPFSTSRQVPRMSLRFTLMRR